ncbi:Sensor histidine kinase [Sulfitobacter noctilucae]|uniref:sensor histidine kinase n=1 Tax=Sulfitobacter noctilucae TaxID=1342302 RepID=UPI000468765B|nr:sensor histidine kinase [Sulfitobacter noctilucae]KIN65833.1 Sensor histidine kinase [Sulfitobacter noctilucae]
MTSGFFSGQLIRGLALRVLFFLSLALFPIGLIAVGQTQQISKQNRTNAELSLLAITEQASSAERQILQEAFSAGDALSSIIPSYRENLGACRDLFGQYQMANPQYSVAGFIEIDGRVRCSSMDEAYDVSDNPVFKALVDPPERQAVRVEFGSISRRPVTVVSVPVFDGEELAGLTFVSIPSETFSAIEESPRALSPLALMTFNSKGAIITSERGYEDVQQELPADLALKVFVGDKPTVFEAKNALGQNRVYAVQAIVPNTIYAVSVWPDSTPFLNPSILVKMTALLPIAMWAASLIVAFWALNRLAIRHIRKLGRQMRRFALNRNLPRTTLGAGVPTELVDMEAAFIGMGESILRDEATLEDSLREKNILLKEVHHRVKNNLQLISSIMNMQIRQARTEDSRLVLRRLQERILSLATVHKNLYQNDDLVRVDAYILLHEVVNQLLSVGLAPGSRVKVTQNYAPITIDADDAAPLTLLVSEAMTNALKYVPQNEDGAFIDIQLTSIDDENAQLVLRNTVGGMPQEEGTGLGSRLIDAFSRQLNGQVEVTQSDDVFQLTITFPVPQAAKQQLDY